MRLKDYNCVYINLDDRTDRKKIFIDQYKHISNKTPLRISAVNGYLLDNKTYRIKISKELGIKEDNLRPEFWLNRSNFKTMITDKKKIMGRVGCFLSHLKAMKIAIEKNWANILVMEDDVKLLPNSVNIDFTPPKNSDLCYLGGMFWHLNEQPPQVNNQWIKINPDTLKLIGTFAYCINNKKTIQDIYNLCNSVFLPGKGHDKHPNWRMGEVKMRAQAMDFLYINYFQRYGNCFVINPVLFAHFEDLGSNISPHYGTSSQRWKHHFYYHPNQNKESKQSGGSTIPYSFIFDPNSNKYFNIYSFKGQMILNNYLINN
jgi:GR25 family glycosyltransferase involved in LPS biosynthesis